jgi:putative heme-binding domain-containing protein
VPFVGRVFAALGRVEDPKLAEVILQLHPKLATELQPLAIDLLMQRETWARKVLDAVLANKLPRAVLNANHLRKILDSNDREALWAVEKAFGRVRDERNPEREKVVADMAAYFREHLGDPHRGRNVFRQVCAQCHSIYGEGGKLGPDLTANGRASFDQLLSNVFDPSLVIGPGYQVTTVVTKDGRNLTGLVSEDNDQRIVIRLPGEGEETVRRHDVKYTRLNKLSMMPEGLETLVSKSELADLFAFLALDALPDAPTAKPIPGAPDIPARSGIEAQAGRRVKLEAKPSRLVVRGQWPGGSNWVELATYRMETNSRPYLHPVRDASGRTELTEDRPEDHPWQHGIFTGFHRVNGFNYWKEDQGRQRFVRLLELKEAAEQVTWRALLELVAPNRRVVLEEEDTITIHAPESTNAYVLDFDLLLRALGQEVTFEKYFVGGLAVRLPWDKEHPRQTHLNANGHRGRACELDRAAWCTVERPFGQRNEIFGVAMFEHPSNPNHPSGWRVDEQGLINPNVSSLGDWKLAPNQTRSFRYRLLVYRGTAMADDLAKRFTAFSRESPRQP